MNLFKTGCSQENASHYPLRLPAAKKPFDGILLAGRYIFDMLDMALWDPLLLKEMDVAGEVERHPDYPEKASIPGSASARSVGGGS